MEVGKLKPDYGIWASEAEFIYQVTQQGSIMLNFTFVMITLVPRVEWGFTRGEESGV